MSLVETVRRRPGRSAGRLGQHLDALSRIHRKGRSSARASATPFRRPTRWIAKERAADVQRLMAKLRAGSEEERSQVADDLACYGPSAADAIPLMIQLFAARLGEVQGNAVSAVAYIGEPAVPHLIKALSDDDLRIRQNACDALSGIGPAAKAALPALAALAVGAADTAGHAESALRRIMCGVSR